VASLRLVPQRIYAKLAGMNELARLEATGRAHHRAGRLAQAEACYRGILAAEPANVTALHLLGLLAHQSGQPQAAVDLYARAIAVNDRVPELFGDLGHALHALGRLPEAADSCRRALALRSDYVPAHNDLGVILMTQGFAREAEACWRTAIALRPDHPDAHSNLGSALCAQGSPAEAEACCRRTLALAPDHAFAHNNLGNALNDQGRWDEAKACYRRAIALSPDFAEPHNNLGRTLEEKGRLAEAEACYRRALELKPDYAEAIVNLGNMLIDRGDIAMALDTALRGLGIRESIELKRLFTRCLRSAGSEAIRGADPALRRYLRRALAEPWGRPAELAAFAAAVLQQDAVIGPVIGRAAAAWPNALSAAELLGATDLAAIDNELLIGLLESTPVCDLTLEHFLTALRRGVLATATAEPEPKSAGEDMLRLACALARQCFINEYVFAVADGEAAEVARLQEAVATRLSADAAIPALWLAALGGYLSLGSLANAACLLDRAFPAPLNAVLTQQIREPLAEQAERQSIPRLTPITDDVSRIVQQQYEENPYPRWVRTAAMASPATIAAWLRRQIPGAPIQGLGRQEDAEILIAGCGTGQHAVESAQRFPHAHILAIDLSRASLAHARRRSRALGLGHVDYAQADILQLGTLGKSFDLIEAVGVLHHLADPLAGWRILVALLREGGVMRIGLYSAVARSDIAAAQRLIAERGYGRSAQDVRKFRRDLQASAPELAARLAARYRDFFSTSECRDLLFHRQERCFTLPQIKSFLAEEKLVFLGFETEGATLQVFRHHFSDREALADLDRWHEFEAANPQTFAGMYQFYVQKP
jgi:tetratricopeptide (TPR) repeat protein/SAM-dependent methyltransferase